MKILVTGGAGFIGSHLVDRLIKEKHQVAHFSEKVDNENNRIIGDFFALKPEVLVFTKRRRKEATGTIVVSGELMECHHDGFWKAMDILCDKIELEKLWNGGGLPWKKW